MIIDLQITFVQSNVSNVGSSVQDPTWLHLQ